MNNIGGISPLKWNFGYFRRSDKLGRNFTSNLNTFDKDKKKELNKIIHEKCIYSTKKDYSEVCQKLQISILQNIKGQDIISSIETFINDKIDYFDSFGGDVFEVFENEDGFYTGELTDNFPDGLGRLEKNNGDLYQGHYQKGELISGFIQRDNGDVCAGDFSNNQSQGSGILKFKNGAVYDGEWKDG
ncbi:MAG: hypothetical protein HRT90_05595, partial [Candidatus Margulisbacteria bacterium]|nr:hypothetical protein [Candidatus Margulisiibacteriota bacterium]